MDKRTFSTQRAMELGLEESIVLEALEEVIRFMNEDSAGSFKPFGLQIEIKIRREREHKWVRLSVADMHFIFPWWSLKQIRRLVDRLVAKDKILAAKFDTKEFSQTKYYARIEEDLI